MSLTNKQKQVIVSMFMITTVLFDFSRVLLFPKNENYTGTLNSLHKQLTAENPHYNFFEYFKLNDELLDYLKPIKHKISLNIFTTDVVQKRPEVKQILDEVFENIFAANDFGLSKKDPKAYLFIAAKLNKFPGEILFIDDTLENLAAAEQAGLNTYQYTNTNDLFDFLSTHVEKLRG